MVQATPHAAEAYSGTTRCRERIFAEGLVLSEEVGHTQSTLRYSEARQEASASEGEETPECYAALSSGGSISARVEGLFSSPNFADLASFVVRRRVVFPSDWSLKSQTSSKRAPIAPTTMKSKYPIATPKDAMLNVPEKPSEKGVW